MKTKRQRKRLPLAESALGRRDTTWFVGVSALTGAAIRFASTQTVGNFLAELYVMMSRPFMVRDY